MNAFFTEDALMRVFKEVFQHAQFIEVERKPGWDIGSDLAWQARVRVKTDGMDRTCYLSSLDLMRTPEELACHLIHTWCET